MSKPPGPDRSTGASSGVSLSRLVPLLVLIAGLIAFFAFGLDEYVTFQTLRDHRSELMQFVAQRPLEAILLFGMIYALATAFSIPGGAILTITGGFLFDIWLGTAIVVVAATTGATALFLAAGTALGDALRVRAGSTIKRMEAGFRENALSYLLVLRLIPLFPFFLVNLVPALLGVPLPVYVLGTFLGIVPGTFVYVSIGAGLGSVFDSMQEFSLRGALTPQVIVALVGLAFLSLLPVAYKKWKSRRGAGR